MSNTDGICPLRFGLAVPDIVRERALRVITTAYALSCLGLAALDMAHERDTNSYEAIACLDFALPACFRHGPQKDY